MNCYDYIDVNTPFGGYKNSGIGKELGEDGLSNYLETKTVIIKRGYLQANMSKHILVGRMS